MSTGELTIEVPADKRDFLLSIKAGRVPFDKVNRLRLRLLDEMAEAYQSTRLPDRPNYEKANTFLVRVRQMQVEA